MSTLEHPSSPTSTMPDSSSADLQADHPGSFERIIKPSTGWLAIDWKELYQTRELFDTLILRDIRIRYKQTSFGVAWAIVQPLLTMLVFTLIFRNFAGVKPPDVPYPLYVFAGLVPWTFFTSAVSASGTSLLAQQQLLTKVYFPRVFVPASTVGAYLVDMAIGLGLFAILLPYYHRMPSVNLIFLPFVVILTFAAAFGFGLILASMTILYRDLRFIIPFILQLMMFASPIFYQPAALARPIQLLVAINPVTGIITAYRWSILGSPLDIPAFLISILVTSFVLVFGLFFFRKTEKYFADLL